MRSAGMEERTLPDPLEVEPLPGPVRASIRPPGSKSMTNRAVLLAALARGESLITGALTDADDAERMLSAVEALGAQVDRSGGELRITGVDARWATGGRAVRLDLNNAGTAVRFLTAASVLADAPVTIDGNERMRERPIGELVSALRGLGVSVAYGGREGCPPVTVTPGDLGWLGEDLELGVTSSGQFISALLMLGGCLPRGLTLRLRAPATSASYVRMTLEMLSRVGASVRTSADMRVMRVGPSSWDRRSEARAFDAFRMQIEPDASGATYFWGAAALCAGTRVRVEGLGVSSVQGDTAFCDVLARMGAIVRTVGDNDDAFEVEGGERLLPVLADMGDMPDAAVTLAVLCAFADGASVLRGVRTLRVKECDRIAALAAELGKIGVQVEADAAGDPDAMTIVPPSGGIDCSATAPRVAFDTYGDHRMAMALALVGLRRPHVLIRDPACVGKTYPSFWQDLERLRRSPRRASASGP